MLVKWQVFGTAEVEPDFDTEDFSDEIHWALNGLDGFRVDGLDWSDSE